MIRIIVKGVYMLPGGNCETDHKTFDLEDKELEEYLFKNISFGSRFVIGAEVIKKAKESLDPPF